ncbi:MAG: hypothetical protein K8F91_08780 [Candidatus Obscuribacterales bacterium]|nr:hypothetical protein [Candidatus Obscuribacterales bacterium]
MDTFMFSIGLIAAMLSGAWTGEWLVRQDKPDRRLKPLICLASIIALYWLRDSPGAFGCLCAFLSALSTRAFSTKKEPSITRLASSEPIHPAGNLDFSRFGPKDDPFARRNTLASERKSPGNKPAGRRRTSTGRELCLVSHSGKPTGKRGPNPILKSVK